MTFFALRPPMNPEHPTNPSVDLPAIINAVNAEHGPVCKHCGKPEAEHVAGKDLKWCPTKAGHCFRPLPADHGAEQREDELPPTSGRIETDNPCLRCNGTGLVNNENNVCYSCDGSGKQTDAAAPVAETPETDAAAFDVISKEFGSCTVVDWEIAGNLERQRNALQAQLSAALAANERNVSELEEAKERWRQVNQSHSYGKYATILAERDKLTIELTEAKRDLSRAHNALDERDALRDRVAELEQDGLRMEWLVGVSSNGGPIAEKFDAINSESEKDGVRFLMVAVPYKATQKAASIRQAIDCAIAAQNDGGAAQEGQEGT